MSRRLSRTLLSRPPPLSSALLSLGSVLALALIFAAYRADLYGSARLLAARRDQVFGQGQYWRLFTATLVHADLEHLGSNALFFGGLAFLLHAYYGAWVFPVLSLLAGVVINGVTLALYPGGVTLLGASGVVYFMAASWLTLYYCVERGLSPICRVLNTASFALALLFPQAFDPRVSYLAHGVGFALGVLAGVAFFLFRREELRRHEVWKTREDPDALEAPETHWIEPDGLSPRIQPTSECPPEGERACS